MAQDFEAESVPQKNSGFYLNINTKKNFLIQVSSCCLRIQTELSLLLEGKCINEKDN